MKLIEMQMVVWATNIEVPKQVFKQSTFKFYVNASVEFFEPNIAPYFSYEPQIEFVASNTTII
jgi:hypothetical protein